ncbi:MAG: carbohydrate-binding family 9-like protein [Flavobacteriaceae bacterium]|nr:carbohydrate-binding family 9-like protein [Flavobacteriaceae bacterium]
MKKHTIILLVFLPMILLSQSAPRSYVAYETINEVKIDGKATEEDWGKVLWSEDFTDIEGKKKPKYQTRFKMLWDKRYLYFFAKLEEPHIWGDITKRDAVIFYNNDFEVFIDPNGDTHNYYELEMNALNTVWDLFLTKPYRENGVVLNNWDIQGLKTAVSIEGTLNNAKDKDQYWTVEIAIPWKTLVEVTKSKDIPKNKFWRINFSRVNWDFDLKDGKYSRKKDDRGAYLPEYNWVWSPQGVINMHEPEKWGYVFFSPYKIGTKKDTFVIPNDEKIKWYLYELYKKKDKGKLKGELQDVIIANERIKINFEEHQSGWNLWVDSPFTNKVLSVNHDGMFQSK